MEWMESDPYKTPEAVLTKVAPLAARLFSINQITTAAFIGGPFSGCWMLARNYESLGDFPARRHALTWGVLLTLALGTLSFAFPWRPLGQLIVLGCTVGIREIAKTSQGKELERLFAVGARPESW